MYNNIFNVIKAFSKIKSINSENLYNLIKHKRNPINIPAHRKIEEFPTIDSKAHRRKLSILLDFHVSEVKMYLRGAHKPAPWTQDVN